MDDLEQINARLAAINCEQEAIENESIRTGGKFSPDGWNRYQALDREYSDLVAKRDELKEAARKSPSIPSRRTPEPTAMAPGGFAPASNGPFSMQNANKKFSSLFESDSRQHHTDSSGAFKTLQEFVRSATSGLYDPKLAMASEGQSGYSDPYGGFAIPQQFSDALMNEAIEESLILPRANLVPLTSRSIVLPRWANYDRRTSLYGGLECHWGAEGNELDESRGSLEQMVLEANRLAVYCKATRELLEDSSFGAKLEVAMRNAAAFELDAAFLSANGAGKPRGAIHDPSTIVVSPEPGQKADTIVYENVVNMFSRLAPACRKRAIWICSNDAIPQLMTMVQTVGTGGTPVEALKRTANGYELLGLPLFFSEKVPALGDKGDIVLADWSQYVVAVSRLFAVETSTHVGFQKNEVHFRLVARVDGAPAWREPETPRNGQTQSWCVVLDSRS